MQTRSSKSKARTIFLDYDLTLTKEDSGGNPTPEKNSSLLKDVSNFMDELSKLQKAGYNVVVLTDSHKEPMEVLFNIHVTEDGCVMNGFSPGKVSIYAPESARYNQIKNSGADAVADDKMLFIKSILEKTEGKDSPTGRNSFYIDDSKLNVCKMATRFEDLNCVFAKKGDVAYTYKMLHFWLDWNTPPQINVRRGGKRLTRKRY